MFEDYCSWDGANALADKIRNYWRKQGQIIEPHVEHAAMPSGRGGIFVVRSDLVNGLPVKREG